MVQLCEKLKINYKIYRSKRVSGSHSALTISVRDRVRIFGEFLYQGDDTIGLKRKYNKYKEIIEKPIKKKYQRWHPHNIPCKYKSIDILTGEEKIYECSKDITAANFCKSHVSRCINHPDQFKAHKGFRWERLTTT